MECTTFEMSLLGFRAFLDLCLTKTDETLRGEKSVRWILESQDLGFWGRHFFKIPVKFQQYHHINSHLQTTKNSVANKKILLKFVVVLNLYFVIETGATDLIFKVFFLNKFLFFWLIGILKGDYKLSETPKKVKN